MLLSLAFSLVCINNALLYNWGIEYSHNNSVCVLLQAQLKLTKLTNYFLFSMFVCGRHLLLPWELRDQLPSAWTTMILIQSFTAHGDTHDTVIIYYHALKQTIWLQLSLILIGTSEVWTRDLWIWNRLHSHLSYHPLTKKAFSFILQFILHSEVA